MPKEFSNINEYEPGENIIDGFLNEIISKYNRSFLLTIELPVEDYSNGNIAPINYLTKMGYSGVYICFQRPKKNILKILEENSIDTDKIEIIDCTSFNKEYNAIEGKYQNELDLDKILNLTISILDNTKTTHKFLCIDSLNTLSLLKSENEVSKFSKNLVDYIKNNISNNIIAVFNFASDLSEKTIIKEITNYSDEVINIKNSDELHPWEVI